MQRSSDEMSRRRPVQLCTPPSSSGTHCHTASSHTLHRDRHTPLQSCQATSSLLLNPTVLVLGSLVAAKISYMLVGNHAAQTVSSRQREEGGLHSQPRF